MLIDNKTGEIIFESIGKVAGAALVGREGEWLKVNTGLTTLLEFSESELLKLKFDDLTQNRSELTDDWLMANKVINKEIRNYEMTKDYTTKTNKVYQCKLYVFGIYDNNDDFKFFLSLIADPKLIYTPQTPILSREPTIWNKILRTFAKNFDWRKAFYFFLLISFVFELIEPEKIERIIRIVMIFIN